MTILESETRTDTAMSDTFPRGVINDGDTVTLRLRNGEIRSGTATITELRNVTAVSINGGDVAIINHDCSVSHSDPYDVLKIEHTPYGEKGIYAFRRDESGDIGIYQNYVCITSLPKNFTVEDAWKKMTKAERFILECDASHDIGKTQSVRYHRAVMKKEMYQHFIFWMSK